MIERHAVSPALRRLRLTRRCWRLLDRATVPPENVPLFLRTYRLPKDPFFGLFLATKRDWLAHRRELRAARERYIELQMARLSSPVRAFLIHVARIEEGARGNYPLWRSTFWPRTKKQVDAYHRRTKAQWRVCFDDHLRVLRRQCHVPPLADLERMLACFDLGIAPEIPPETGVVQARFRELSKRLHPDVGGDAEAFRRLREARDILLLKRG